MKHKHRCNFRWHDERRSNPNLSESLLRNTLKNYTLMGYEFYIGGWWFDVAILFDGKLVLFDLADIWNARDSTKRMKDKIAWAKENNIPLKVIKPNSPAYMQAEVDIFLMKVRRTNGKINI